MTGSDPRHRVLLVGPGDLGRRLALALAGCPEIGELVIAGRRSAEGEALAALIAACGQAVVRFQRLDVRDRGGLEDLLRRERPELVVQCAAALSPWHIPGRADPLARALAAAGFAVELPAQLLAVTRVMEAVRELGSAVPVVNASYPDLTHPILARRGLAPTLGIGNAGMIRARVCAHLRAQGPPGSAEPLVRVLAHHAHVTPVVRSRRPADGPWPRVYLGEEGRRADELAWAAPPLRSSPGLNALPAASGLQVLRALLDPGRLLRTSVPGPSGLPGGYPVTVDGPRVELDLPPGLELGEALDFQRRSARLDGVESIAEDGTVHFTSEAREAVARYAPELCEPLSPEAVEARLDRLLGVLEGP